MGGDTGPPGSSVESAADAVFGRQETPRGLGFVATPGVERRTVFVESFRSIGKTFRTSDGLRD